MPVFFEVRESEGPVHRCIGTVQIVAAHHLIGESDGGSVLGAVILKDPRIGARIGSVRSHIGSRCQFVGTELALRLGRLIQHPAFGRLGDFCAPLSFGQYVLPAILARIVASGENCCAKLFPA